MSRTLSTPIYRITVAGNDITAATADRLLSLAVPDNTGEEADSFELQLDDGEPYIPNSSTRGCPVASRSPYSSLE